MKDPTKDAPAARAALTQLRTFVDNAEGTLLAQAAAVVAAGTKVTTLTAQNNVLTGQVASLTIANSTLQGQLTDANARVAGLQEQATVDLAKIATLTGQVGDLQAQVSTLQAQLDAALHPPKPAVRFAVGASVPDPRLGDLPVQRTYAVGALGVAPKKASVHSFKTWDQAALTRFVKAAVPGQVIANHHEPEDDIEAGRLTVEDWVQRQIALCQTVIDTGRVGQVTPAVCLMGWSMNPKSNRSALLARLADPVLIAKLKEARGIWAWDAYAGPGATDGPDKEPAALYGTLAAWNQARGLAWAIFETGARQDTSTDPKLHAAWWQRVFDWLSSTTPPTHFLAWNREPLPGKIPAGETPFTYAIQDLPDVTTVWRGAMDKYSR